MTASARPHLHLMPDRLDAAGVGDDADDRCLPDGSGGQLRQNRFRVLVAGDTKRDKSTLLNVLLGRDVLPTGVVPVPALATMVRGGGPEGMVLRSTDGRVGQHDVHNLAKYVSQTANPGNRLGIAEVVLQLHAPLLADGVELVDTPGTGSVHSQNTDEALASACTMDTAIFVLTADPPVSAAEQELLRLVAQASVRTFVVLNKADLLDPADLPEATPHATAVVAQALGAAVSVYVCAARAAVRRGVDKLAASLSAYFTFTQRRDVDLLISLSCRARQPAAGLLDDVLLALAAADLDVSRKQEHLSSLGEHLDALDQRGEEAVGLVRAHGCRTVQEVNATAEQAAATLPQQVADAWAAQWDEHCAGRTGRDREAEGRRRLAALTRTAVDRCRGKQEHLLTTKPTALDRRLCDRLAHDLDTLRGTVPNLLGVSLVLPQDSDPLAANPRLPCVGVCRATTGRSGPAHLWLGRRLTRLTARGGGSPAVRSVPGR